MKNTESIVWIKSILNMKIRVYQFKLLKVFLETRPL